MFPAHIIRQLKVPRSLRHFNSSATMYKDPPTQSNVEKPNLSQAQSKQEEESPTIGTYMYRVNIWDKRLLVFTKRYPSIDAVPETVTRECILTARSRFRVKSSFYVTIMFVMIFIYTAVTSKKKAERQREKSMN